MRICVFVIIFRMNKPYTEREKLLVAQLVREQEVIENKKTDGATLQQKNKAWELISISFNSQPEITGPRSAGQLKKLWSNLKHKYINSKIIYIHIIYKL